ncbi:hypothetical protein LSAT2_019393 [Lamellibrachia satsuma]|nr:hypothetical protein LSAT2_019393 [Lamellibrachia satsuma]
MAQSPSDAVAKGPLTDKFFMRVARHELNSDEHIQLGVFLLMTRSVVRDIIHDSEGTVDSTFAILESWRNKTTGTTSNDLFEQLCAAYLELKKTDVAEYIRSQQVQYLNNLLQKARETTRTCRQKSNEQMRLVKDDLRQSKEGSQKYNEEVCRLRDTVKCQQEEK